MNDIQFKRLTKEGYDSYKLQSKPNVTEHNLRYDGAYLSKDFKSRLNYSDTNTVVLNAGVGSGKSSLGYELMLEYASKGYVVFVASPFISLTQKDYKHLTAKAEEDLAVVNYADLSKGNVLEYAEADIHVATIHLILGDSGQDGRGQASYKRQYLDEISKYWSC